MRITGFLGLAGLVAFAGCADQESAAPTAPEPAGKLVVSKHKAGGRKERRRHPGNPTSQMIKMEELRFGQPLVVERLGGKVHLQLEEVQDSRCPDGVTCIWAGEAKVSILAWDEDEKMQHRFTLTLGSEKESQGHTGRHTILLFGVNPYPRAGQPAVREDYVVQLGVIPTPEEGQVIKY